MKQKAQVAPVLVLIGVTAIWGWTFLVVRQAVAVYPVIPFLAIRFAIASLTLLPVVVWKGSRTERGILAGTALAAAYLFQTYGLQHTSASKAGLLTGLFVVLTPLLEFVLYRRRPPLLTVVAVLTAMCGTALLAGPDMLVSNAGEMLGDSLEILAAICVAIHLIVLGRVSRLRSATGLALTQMITATVLFSAAALRAGLPPRPPVAVWGALLITGVLASAVAFLVQTSVQQRIAPSRTALILVAEPVFAMVFGIALSGERFSILQATGAGLILAALLLHEGAPLRFSATTRGAGT